MFGTFELRIDISSQKRIEKISNIDRCADTFQRNMFNVSQLTEDINFFGIQQNYLNKYIL